MTTLSPHLVTAIFLAYMAALFLIALWVERGTSEKARNLARSPLVYSLSLAVYCTSWTYYGSVGSAVTSGMLFLTIYLGPTMAVIFWWSILRKLVRIKTRYRVTSIADFISARYDRSQLLAAMAAIAAFLGTVPYIALQLKAVLTTFAIVSPLTSAASWTGNYVGHIVVLLMIAFTIVFGVRRIDPTERHQGIIMAVATESLVKLVAFLAVGVFVTYFLYDGFGDIFQRIANSPHRQHLSFGGSEGTTYTLWTTYLILGMAAVMFLPRQFHVAVVENTSEKNILSAMWLFPLYMLLINIFVAPIAMGGLLKGFSPSQADTFVLRLPMEYGNPLLTLFVFIGGLSAATSMIMISAMTMATMLTNHLVLPLTEWISPLGFLKRYMLQCRWAAVTAFILFGYWFERVAGTSYMLVNIGIMSFVAALQFAPPILFGIYWKGATRRGAIWGMAAGFTLWVYTMLLPALAESAWFLKELVTAGPLGIGFLKPNALFGLSALDPITHTVFWSMFFNIGLLTLGSLSSRPGDEAEILAASFVDALRTEKQEITAPPQEPTIPLEQKRQTIFECLAPYFPPPETEAIFAHSLTRTHLQGRTHVSVAELDKIVSEVERSLAGSFGAASAHRIITRSQIYSAEETVALRETYTRMLAEFEVSPDELRRKIDYYQEKEELLQKHAQELEARVQERDREILERKRVEETLRRTEERLRAINAELDQGLSEVFEALNEISSGNPNVKISEDSTVEVVSQLKRRVNMTAENLEEIVDLSHDFAIGLAEHFDVLHRVSQGNLAARVGGTSGVELLESLKNVTNQMIDSVSTEINERMRAEQEVKESEARLENILNSLPTGIVVIDEETRRIVDANPAAIEMMKASHEQIIGHECHGFMCVAREGQCPVSDLGQMIDNSEREILALDGERVPIIKTVIPFLLDGRRHLLESFIDMTRVKEAEAEKKKLQAHLQRAEKMEVVGTLAGGVAHDLNNILSGLVSYPELLLLDLPEDSPLRGPILTIQKSGKKAAAIVQDLLTLARRGVAVTEVSNLNDLIKDYLASPEFAKLQSYHEDVTIRTELDPSLLNILGSPVHLSKTVMNLVSNAAEALPEGGEVVLSTRNCYIDTPVRGYDKVDEGEYCVLEITDNGIGIGADDLERIFEPFYTKKVMGRSGTGLGMAVVWGTVKDHKGYVDIDSSPGRGTTVTLYFPVTRTQADDRATPIPLEDLTGGGETILVIDDVKEQRDLAVALLNKLGYETHTASSGKEAITFMKQHSADLLVLDMIMDPGIDGLDTYKEILALHREQKAIIASGFSASDRVKEAQRLGADQYVKKPYTLEKIGLAVKTALEKPFGSLAVSQPNDTPNPKREAGTPTP